MQTNRIAFAMNAPLSFASTRTHTPTLRLLPFVEGKSMADKRNEYTRQNNKITSAREVEKVRVHRDESLHLSLFPALFTTKEDINGFYCSLIKNCIFIPTFFSTSYLYLSHFLITISFHPFIHSSPTSPSLLWNEHKESTASRMHAFYYSNISISGVLLSAAARDA